MKRCSVTVCQVPRPTTYDAHLRERLLHETAAALARGGVDAVSLRRVAAAAGTSTSAVYALFGGRDDLVAASTAAAEDGFTAAQVAAIATPTADPVADIHALGRAYRAWALANPERYTVMFGGRVQRPAKGIDPTDPPASIVPLLTCVRRLQEAGLVADRHTLEVARSVWASVHGYVSLEIVEGPGTEADYRRHLSALLSGWGTRAGQLGTGTY